MVNSANVQSAHGDIFEAGVDYLTATVKTESARDLLFSAVETIIQTELLRGAFARPWRSMGYEGLQVGSLQVGERYDTAIVRLSSDVAARNFRAFQSLQPNITRLDLQFTCRTDCDVPRSLGHVYRRAQLRPAGKHARPNITLIAGTNGAATLYVGARTSELYGRIYDKSVESGQLHYRSSFRAEVETKGAVAMGAFAAVCSHVSAERFAVDQVANYFSVRLESLEKFLRAHGLARTDLQHLLLRQNHAPQELSGDCLDALTWIRRQVRPTVEHFKSRGLLDYCLDALGLAELKTNPNTEGENDADYKGYI